MARDHVPSEIRRRILVEAIPTCRATTTEVAHIVPWAQKCNVVARLLLCSSCLFVGVAPRAYADFIEVEVYGACEVKAFVDQFWYDRVFHALFCVGENAVVGVMCKASDRVHRVVLSAGIRPDYGDGNEGGNLVKYQFDNEEQYSGKWGSWHFPGLELNGWIKWTEDVIVVYDMLRGIGSSEKLWFAVHGSHVGVVEFDTDTGREAAKAFVRRCHESFDSI